MQSELQRKIDLKQEQLQKIAGLLTKLVARRKVEAKLKADKVVEGVYLGCYSSACNREFLEGENIKRIVMCLGHLPPPFPEQFTYKQIPVKDHESQDISKYFDQAYDFIEQGLKNNERVLVHCFAGVSRSTTILAAYFVKKERKEPKEVVAWLREKRPVVNPNGGFMRQLQGYYERVVAEGGKAGGGQEGIVVEEEKEVKVDAEVEKVEEPVRIEPVEAQQEVEIVVQKVEVPIVEEEPKVQVKENEIIVQTANQPQPQPQPQPEPQIPVQQQPQITKQQTSQPPKIQQPEPKQPQLPKDQPSVTAQTQPSSTQPALQKIPQPQQPTQHTQTTEPTQSTPQVTEMARKQKKKKKKKNKS